MAQEATVVARATPALHSPARVSVHGFSASASEDLGTGTGHRPPTASPPKDRVLPGYQGLLPVSVVPASRRSGPDPPSDCDGVKGPTRAPPAPRHRPDRAHLALRHPGSRCCTFLRSPWINANLPTRFRFCVRPDTDWHPDINNAAFGHIGRHCR